MKFAIFCYHSGKNHADKTVEAGKAYHQLKKTGELTSMQTAAWGISEMAHFYEYSLSSR